MPYIVIAVLALLVGSVLTAQRLPPVDRATGAKALQYFGGALVVTIAVFMVVTLFCQAIRPYEQFVDGSGSVVVPTAPTDAEVTALLKDITDTETEVCHLITRTDKFIQNDVGKAGQDDPQAVQDAISTARQAVGGPLTDCTVEWPDDVSGAAALDEADNRLTRMEATLKSYTGPEIEKTYNTTVPCQSEGFQDGSGSEMDTFTTLKSRLAAVKTTIQTQRTKWLKPIDKKTAALQRGEVSDCDKKRGAKTAMATSNKAGPPPASGPTPTSGPPPKAPA